MDGVLLMTKNSRFLKYIFYKTASILLASLLFVTTLVIFPVNAQEENGDDSAVKNTLTDDIVTDEIPTYSEYLITYAGAEHPQ